MYERMLDKKTVPAYEDMRAHCGEAGDRFSAFNDWLSGEHATARVIAFPYGNKYGWGVAHRVGKALICYAFAESGAFTVMLHLTGGQFAAAYDSLSDRAKEVVDCKFPCGSGGWIHFRVLTDAEFADIELLVSKKFLKL